MTTIYNSIKKSKNLLLKNNTYEFDTKFGVIKFLGNRRPLALEVKKEQEYVYVVKCKVVEDSTVIKLHINTTVNDVVVFEPTENQLIILKRRGVHEIDFRPDHVDSEGKPIEVVIENIDKIFNENSNESNNFDTIFYISKFKAPKRLYFGETECDGGNMVDAGMEKVRQTVQESSTKYVKINEDRDIDYDEQIKIVLQFTY
ncbi:hypothetical protein [Parapoynx stagnalis nucleopolyhedrovirus]|uniref:Uncharacterized protein n=1 Tax=Parapoynx stagnalis nucleopolyhedrovirus TaxID=2993413 RepID=A0A9E8C331_9ABAC|nr:hypothetical protein [Parapoynx stagnalis nucleopolyhedrovirus]